MARVIHVKSAQQRYETKPVIDPATGKQKLTPVMKNGVQKQSKRGPVFLRVTENDTTKPLPNHKCEKCSNEIKVGDPYKHVTVKKTYGGVKHIRCANCPSWQPWDLSDSVGARTARITYEFEQEVASFETKDDLESALTTAAEGAREIAEEKRESAQSLADGFGHDTEQSQELEQLADELDGWADEIESYLHEIDDVPAAEDEACEECDGVGQREPASDDDYAEDDLDADGRIECPDCGGSGHPDEVSEDSIEEWRGNIELPACPV